MELYKALQWRKQAKKHEQAYLASEPPIPQGNYGPIPATFGIHLGGFGDSNLAYYYLCSPGPNPLFAVSGYTGARVVTVHSTVDLKSAPLAYVTVPKAGFHLHGSISLPAPASSASGPGEASVGLPFDGSGGVMSPVYQFEAQIEGAREMFAWQQVGKHERGKPRLYELTRNVTSEKVARWREDFVPAEGKMAEFEMLGSGELGEALKLAAVVSILAVARMDWAAEKTADQMVARGGRALGKMVEAGFGIAAASFG